VITNPGMKQATNRRQSALRVLLAGLICSSLCGRCLSFQQKSANETDDLARQLMANFTDDDKKGVIVMDLQSADGQWTSFGRWLAEELSVSLANQGTEVKVVDRAKLAAEVDAQHLSPGDVSLFKNSIPICKAIGAVAMVTGSYGAADNGVGMSLRAFRLSEFDVPNSTRFEIGRVFGKIPLTQDVSTHLNAPLDSLRPKDGIYKAGMGGVGVPTCVQCRAPNMHVPDIDLQGLLRAKPNGFIIRLVFVVTVDGHATQVTVSQPVGFGVDEQYVKAAREWEFKPAVDADNKPVPVLWDITMSAKFK
jgi:FlgO protein